MSLYSALSAGVAGLSAEASALASASDNIANINTIGYKNVDTQFSTLVGDGRSTKTYSAGGVTAAPRTLISKGGLLQASSSSTDIGIEGQGFFITRTGLGADSTVALTRAGSFSPSKDGYLKNTAGLYLQGWRLDANGQYTNTGSADSLEPIRLTDLTGTAAATTSVTMRANFQSTTTANTDAYAVGDLASGTMENNFKRSIDVYDAQGGKHTLEMAVVKRGDNEWAAEIYAKPASDVGATDGVLAAGTIKFNSDGSLDRAGSAAVTGNTLFDADGNWAALTPDWTNGAASQPITLSLGDDKGLNGLTQFGSASSVIAQSSDGGPLGSVSSVSISDEGVVSAIFENGTTRKVFQLPLATVPNPDGLTRVSGNAYVVSENSGAYAINAPGSLGAGEIQGFTLEASTADLAQEFTNMIRFQRAYSASSKIITTVDDMLQEVTNLKR